MRWPGRGRAAEKKATELYASLSTMACNLVTILKKEIEKF
jgi:hypothetical protein